MTVCNNVVIPLPILNEKAAASPSKSEAQRWADILFNPDDILEIRFIAPKAMIHDPLRGKFLWGQTRRGAGFNPWIQGKRLSSINDELAIVNKSVETFWLLDGRCHAVTSAVNVYCSANPRKRFGGSASSDVAVARSLFVDLESVSVNESQAQRKKVGLPDPTLTVVSGHGVHLYWRLIEPVNDLVKWTTLQKRLIHLFPQADPSVHDPARLMRLPGFQNVNGEPAPCKIVDVNGGRYDLNELEAHLPPLVEGGWNGSTKNGRTPDSNNPETLSNDTETLHRALAYQETVEPAESGQRNSTVFRLAAAVTEKFDLELGDLNVVTNAFNERLDDPLDEAELAEVTEKAYRHVHAKDQVRGTAGKRERPLIPYAQPNGPIRSLEQWRTEMHDQRLASLRRPPTVYFDGSTTGAGKSTADIAAMKAVGRSITLLPTHRACEEHAAKLKENDLDAAAFPAIDSTTCLRYGTDDRPDEAQKAQQSGLDVGLAICPDCPLSKQCGYQKRRLQTKEAGHIVATHARAAHSQFAVAQDRSLVLIHEDCRDLLRPTYTVAAKPTPNTPHLRHLHDIRSITFAAIEIAEEWDDQQKIDFAANLARATKDLITSLQGSDLLNDVIKADSAGDAPEVEKVKSLLLKEPMQRPDRLDLLLYRAMRRTGIDANGEALRLCLAYACGELESLSLVIDDSYGKDGQRQFHQSVVGVRRVDLPDDSIVWLEDATGDLDLLSNLAGSPVSDRTPSGRLDYTVAPIQYALPRKADITMQTSGNVVRGIVRGLLAKHPKAKQVGIITHRVHLHEIEALEPLWNDRIAKLDYFRSGNDRASNSWLECDLLLVLGTPRVPPSAVRHALIQVGLNEDAGQDGSWGSLVWEAKTLNGNIVRVDGLGYQRPSWARMHHILLRDLLLQAVGRGRCVTGDAIPVVVVSSEPLALPFMAEDLALIKDEVAETFMVVTQLSAKFPTVNTVGKIAVSTAQVAELAARKERQVRNHLNLLSSFGLLCREGARGGWTLNTSMSLSA